jgi:peptide/nickel transport system permease protein
MRSSSRRFAIAALVVVHAAVVLAGFLSPNHFAEQHRDRPLSPPMRLRFVDEQGRFSPRPCVHPWEARNGLQYREDRTRRLPVRFWVEGFEYRILGVVPARRHLLGLDDAEPLFLLGTDSYGRDCLARLLQGGQVSLAAGLLATLVSCGLALLLGGLSGYRGGWTDGAIMGVCDLFLALPWLYLLFAVRALLPLDLEPGRAFGIIVLVLGVIGWARPGRLVRGVVLSAKEREFVLAARAFGAGDGYILWNHVLPQALGVLLTQAAILVPTYVLAEVTLSFVGLGVEEPLPSWGTMLASLQEYHVLSTAWWMFAPGVALVAVTWLYHSCLAPPAASEEGRWTLGARNHRLPEGGGAWLDAAVDG